MEPFKGVNSQQSVIFEQLKDTKIPKIKASHQSFSVNSSSSL